MPTMVRSVRKVVLFILVMAVSGVGVAQAQTDPDVTSPRAEAADSSSCLYLSSAGDAAMANRPTVGVITPDVGRQSARLYATAEQAGLVTTSGGTEYMFSASINVFDGWIHHYTVWDFYSINGDETNFFVDTVSTAHGTELSPDEEYRVIEFGASLMVPSIAPTSPVTTRLVTRAPDSAVELSGGQTFSLEYEGASISRRVLASSNTLLEPTSMPDPDGHLFSHNMTVTYLKDPFAVPGDPTEVYPGVFVGGSVAHWNCGSPWGMKVVVWGGAVSSLTGEVHRWWEDENL